jgi:hypothetical protein
MASHVFEGNQADGKIRHIHFVHARGEINGPDLAKKAMRLLGDRSARQQAILRAVTERCAISSHRERPETGSKPLGLLQHGAARY